MSREPGESLKENARDAGVSIPRVINLRVLLLLTASLVFGFVAVVGVALGLRVLPSARELTRRTSLTQTDFLERTRAASALDSALTDLWSQLRLARVAPLNADSLRLRRERIERLISDTATIAPFQRSTRLSPELSIALERADFATLNVAGTLLGAVGMLELRDVASAERLLLRADSLDSPLSEQLTAVTSTTLSEIARDEARLVREARSATTLVVSWLAFGFVLLPMLWWLLRQRLFDPLAALDRSLTRIELGDLEVELAQTRDDELGRLEAHFNRTTRILRDQREITKRVAASEALEVSEAHFRSVFDHAAVGLAEISMDRRYQRINRAMTRILGREEQEIIGHSPTEFTHEADVRADEEAWASLGRMGAGLKPRNKRYRRPDGSLASVQVTATIIADPDGTPQHILSVIHDVTEQLRLERQMLQTRQMDAIGQLAGGVAHDFNNLLTGIIGFADLLEHDGANAPAVREDAASIRSIALRGAELARSLLALARQSAHREEPFALGAMLQETGELIQRTFDRRIHVQLTVLQNATVVGDRSLMSNALLNLSLNARDAMPDGGTLTITARRVPVDAGFRARYAIGGDGPCALIEVVDSGTGMTPEVLERVFEPFFTTKPVGKGTGLGLAMVYGTVQSHGGAILVESTLGEGTRFSIYLPCVGDGVQGAHAPSVPVAARASARILVVDDEDTVRAVAERMLARLGYIVESVGDGFAALERLANDDHGVDLVIMDGNMPRLNGIETARQLHARYPQLPMIYGTGHFDPDTAVDPDSTGFRERLAKPYTMDALSRAVARCLAKPLSAEDAPKALN